MLDETLVILLCIAVISAGTWMYRIGYKDGKREGYLEAAKYRKAATNV